MFDFTIQPKITRAFLLEKNNEETYMSHYLGIPITKSLFRSPLRNDRHNTCSFFRGKSGILYFKDFATGQCLNFEGVVQAKYNCDYHTALKIIAEDFGLLKSQTKKPVTIKIQPKFEEKSQTYIQVETKEFSEAELKWWNQYGITKDILNRFHIYSCKTVFLNGNIFAQSAQHFPIFGYYFGKKENVEQWRIYMPQAKQFRFIGNVSTKTIQGFKQLPKQGKLLVITKSMKDVVCLYSLGITAIAPNSETQFVSDKVLEDLKQRFKYIVVLYDLDHTGIQFSKKIKKEHPELTVTLLPRIDKCKDISDYYKAKGKSNTIKMIANKLKLFKNENLRKI